MYRINLFVVSMAFAVQWVALPSTVAAGPKVVEKEVWSFREGGYFSLGYLKAVCQQNLIDQCADIGWDECGGDLDEKWLYNLQFEITPIVLPLGWRVKCTAVCHVACDLPYDPRDCWSRTEENCNLTCRQMYDWNGLCIQLDEDCWACANNSPRGGGGGREEDEPPPGPIDSGGDSGVGNGMECYWACVTTSGGTSSKKVCTRHCDPI